MHVWVCLHRHLHLLFLHVNVEVFIDNIRSPLLQLAQQSPRAKCVYVCVCERKRQIKRSRDCVCVCVCYGVSVIMWYQPEYLSACSYVSSVFCLCVKLLCVCVYCCRLPPASSLARSVCLSVWPIACLVDFWWPWGKMNNNLMRMHVSVSSACVYRVSGLGKWSGALTWRKYLQLFGK